MQLKIKVKEHRDRNTSKRKKKNKFRKLKQRIILRVKRIHRCDREVSR
jgi:hypothetical protein